MSYTFAFKVSEHSFPARFWLCDSACAQGLQKQTCQWSNHFIYSKPALSAQLFSTIECSVLMALVCYYKDMLGKNPAILCFSLLPKEPS